MTSDDLNPVDPIPVDPTQESPIEAAAAEEVLPIDPVQQLTAERDELRDLLLRTRAEMDNVRKRMNREREEERRYSSGSVVQHILPAFDNLQRAVAAGEQAPNTTALVQGVQMVLAQFEEALGQLGVTAIPSVGQPFDPNVHQALQQFPTSEHPPMTVLQELQKGFLIHDRVIRPSQVIVSCAPAAESSSDQN